MINTSPCTPSEAIEIIKALWNINYAVILWGAPGCGKSELVAQLCKEMSAELRDVRLSQKTAADLGGLPALDHERKCTTFYLPDFLIFDNPSTVCFLDELNGADAQTRIAAYGLILERRVGNYTLPAGVKVIAASNRSEDGALAADLSSALNDRFIHLVIEPTAKDWLQWAIANNICREVMAFIQVQQHMLTGTPEMRQADDAIIPSPRSWARVSTIWKTIREKRLREVTISGIVGDSAASEFMTIAEEVAQMATIEKILGTHALDLHRVIPTTLNGLYGLSYSLAAAVTRETLNRIMDVIDALDALKGKKHDGLPMAEVQALAASVVLERALKLKLDCSEHPAFIRFDTKRRKDNHQQLEEAA
jgi:midasin (ATPase involved in ribosome maturation)